MDDRAEEKFGILSDGEKQKVIMLRALINEPSLLLLDEPVLALDIPSREDMLKAIQAAYRIHGTNIIYVTHHTEEILPQFKHILILDDGSVFYRGPIRDGLYSDRLQLLFDQPVQVLSFKDRHYTMLA
jgi:iron complex transport system ATP-binding protein